MGRKAGVRFVDEYGRAWELVELSERCRVTARERFEELDGGYHYDRSVPEGREMSRKNIVVLGPVVVGRDNILRSLAVPYQTNSVGVDRLVDDVGERKNHKTRRSPLALAA